MKILPMNTKMLVKPQLGEDVTAGGIIIPEKSRERKMDAKVVAIGEKVTTIKKGDSIICRKYSGTELKIGGHDLLIIEEEDAIAVVEGGE